VLNDAEVIPMAVGVKAKLVLRFDAAMTEQEKRSFLVCILLTAGGMLCITN